MLENDVNGLAELDEDILTFDVPDDALERAAPVADRRIMTLYCTKDPLSCGWPVIKQLSSSHYSQVLSLLMRNQF